MAGFGLLIILGSVIVSFLFGDSLAPFFDRIIGIQVALLGLGITLYGGIETISKEVNRLCHDYQTGVRVLNDTTTSIYDLIHRDTVTSKQSQIQRLPRRDQ